MKELQKYFVHPSDIHAHANRFGGDKEIYLASEAYAAFAEMRREHAEEIRHAQHCRTEYQKIIDFVIARGLYRGRPDTESHADIVVSMLKEHAEEIERLNSMLDSARLKAERYRSDFWGEVESLRKQAERYEKLRRLNPNDFSDLWLRNVVGQTFDEQVDQLPASGE